MNTGVMATLGMAVAALLGPALFAQAEVPVSGKRAYLGAFVLYEAGAAGGGSKAWLTDVVAGGPAAAAGLQAEDRIVAINGKALTAKNDQELIRGLATLAAGKPAELEIERSGARLTRTVVPAAASADQIAATEAFLERMDACEAGTALGPCPCSADAAPGLSPYLQLVRHAERLGREIEVTLRLDESGKPVFSTQQVETPPGLATDSILSPLIAGWIQGLRPGQQIRFAVATSPQGFGRVTLLERPRSGE